MPSGCVCPGDTLTYTCTARGGPSGATVWFGTAFDCAINEIVLLHSRFTYGTFATCNNGAIAARSLSIERNNYTSQLNVTINSETAGKTIKCVYDNGVTSTLLYSFILPTSGLSSCIHL